MRMFYLCVCVVRDKHVEQRCLAAFLFVTSLRFGSNRRALPVVCAACLFFGS